jgi:hypothetical protein
MTVFLISKGFKALESREQDWRRIGVLNFTWRMGVFYLGDTYEKIEIIFLTVSSAINFNIHSYQIFRFSLTITCKTLSSQMPGRAEIDRVHDRDAFAASHDQHTTSWCISLDSNIPINMNRFYCSRYESLDSTAKLSSHVKLIWDRQVRHPNAAPQTHG